MKPNKYWLRWVREGKAYTITKSRREIIRLERIRAVALCAGYVAGCVERMKEFEGEKISEEPYYRFVEYGYGAVLEDEYQCECLDDFARSLLESEYSERGAFPTLQRFPYYACDVLIAFYEYCISPTAELRERNKQYMQTRMESLHSPNAGAIARRAFREIEAELRKEATL